MAVTTAGKVMFLDTNLLPGRDRITSGHERTSGVRGDRGRGVGGRRASGLTA